MTAVLQRIAPFFGGDFATFQWWTLRYPHMQALRSWLAASFASATANRWIAAARGVLRCAWHLRQISAEDGVATARS